jgi:FdhD protein
MESWWRSVSGIRITMMDALRVFKTVRSFTHNQEGFKSVATDLLLEVPLEVTINEERQILIMCTPDAIRDLVYGFVFTEAMIESPGDVEACHIQTTVGPDGAEGVEARVTLRPSKQLVLSPKGRRVSYSSCGICGKAGFGDLRETHARVKSHERFSMDALKRIASGMEGFQPLYRRTGGAHAAILADRDGQVILQREDMGRHNALDKVIGAVLLQSIAVEDKVIVSSGRASLEMIIKTARAGFPVFVAMSRPTSKAVEAAKFYNVTLIDMAKDSNRIYSHARRIQGF